MFEPLNEETPPKDSALPAETSTRIHLVNAMTLMESTIGLYKTELIKRTPEWRYLTDIELVTAEWIDWHNHQRLHSAIGYATPAAYEQEYWTTVAPTAPQVTT